MIYTQRHSDILGAPPSCKIEWEARHKTPGPEMPNKVNSLTVTVTAQTWHSARQLAAVKLGVSPESIKVTRKS